MLEPLLAFRRVKSIAAMLLGCIRTGMRGCHDLWGMELPLHISAAACHAPHTDDSVSEGQDSIAVCPGVDHV